MVFFDSIRILSNDETLSLWYNQKRKKDLVQSPEAAARLRLMPLA